MINYLSCLFHAYIAPLSDVFFFVLRSILPIYRVGKSRLTSLSDVITTCVRTYQELATHKNNSRVISYRCEVKGLSNLIREIVFADIADDGINGKHRSDP